MRSPSRRPTPRLALKGNGGRGPMSSERTSSLCRSRVAPGRRIAMATDGTVSRRQALAWLGMGVAAGVAGPASVHAQATDGQTGSASDADGVAAPLSLDTRLTREYSIRFPFVSAG